jgi:hypothetical protein
MKRCPTCQRSYEEDAPDFCPNDGMRLVRETAAGFDPERTVLSSGLRVPEPVLPEPPRPQPPAPPPAPPLTSSYTAEEAANYPPPPRPATQPQPLPPPPPAPNFAPQGWSPEQPPPQAAQPWANPYPSPAPTTPIMPPYLGGGRSRALAIAGLVTGCCAITIMAVIAFRSRGFVLGSLLALAVLGLGFSVAALLLALQKPSRFGGIPLAIAGLATATAAFVYYFTL